MKKVKLIALFAALIVGLGLYQFLKEIGKPQETPRTMVVVATQNITENTLITRAMVELQPVATEALLPNHVRDVESVIGMVLSSNVYAGEQILTDRLVRMGEADSANDTLAYVVEPGMRAISISVNMVTGVSYLVKPGNHVDLIMNYTLVEERDGGREKVEIPTTAMVFQDIKVLAVDRILSKDGALEYATLTLEVTPQEAVEISCAEYVSNIYAVLRSSLDTEKVNTTEVNLENLREKAGVRYD